MRSVDELLAEPAPVFKFTNPGDTVVGVVQSARVRAVTDIKTGAPIHWPSGEVKEQLELLLRNPEDEEIRVFVKAWGDNLKDFRETVGRNIIGTNLRMTFTHVEPDGRKMYEYEVVREGTKTTKK